MNKEVEEAIRIAQSGDKTGARRLLVQHIKTNIKDAGAWYTLSFLVESQEERIKCLRNALKIEPEHFKAKERLQKLKAYTNISPKTRDAISTLTSCTSPSTRTTNTLQITNHQENQEKKEEVSLQTQIPAAKDSLTVEPVTRWQQVLNGSKISVIRKKRGKTGGTAEQTTCLWHTLNEKESPYTPPNVTELLFDDIAKLPIVTNPHQEIWLGVQLKASQRLATILVAQKPHSEQIDYRLFLNQHLFDSWNQLEQSCYSLEIPSPRMEAWAAELLLARKDIYHLNRSKLRRFVRRIQGFKEADISQNLLELTFECVETLSILTTEALGQLVNFEHHYRRLPDASEMKDWLPPEENALKQQIERRTKQVQNVLVTGYLRYVLRIAQNYIGQGVEYDDLVQAGFIGLLRAAKKFDYHIQTRFGSYATSWIWQAVGREIADYGRTVRIPVHVQESLRKWEENCSIYDDGINDPTVNPLILYHANFLDKKDFDVINKAIASENKIPKKVESRFHQATKKVRLLNSYTYDFISHEDISSFPYSKIDTEETLSLSDLLPDSNERRPGSVVDKTLIRQTIEEQIFPYLKPKEREILELRHGFNDGKDRTLEEVGQMFGLTRERIRQIEARAIDKLNGKIVHNLLPDLQSLIPKEESILVPIHRLGLDLKKNQEEIEADTRAEQNRLSTLLEKLPHSDWTQGRSGIRGGARREQLIKAFKILAFPAHFSDIAEQLNETTNGKELDETYVYALLTRDEESFILLGQGIFSLVDWEQARTKEQQPILPCCPIPLPDPPDYEDAFFESVLVGRQALAKGLTSVQFVNHMLHWAKAETGPQNWLLQSLLSAYYLVDLIPYVFSFGGRKPVLQCTLPAASIQDLRYHCLKTVTERLMAMPEFWWLLQQRQPARPTDLGELFTDIHPYGLDDVLQRLRLLASLGAVQKLKYGEYRLTPLGEECANRWKQEVVEDTAVDTYYDLSNDFAEFVAW